MWRACRTGLGIWAQAYRFLWRGRRSLDPGSGRYLHRMERAERGVNGRRRFGR